MGECSWRPLRFWKNLAITGTRLNFFRLVWRATTSGGQPAAEFTWTYGREQKFSRERLRQIFAMALHCGIVEQYRLPPVSAFPLKAQVLFITRFSRQELAKVRRAGRGRRWEALVRALELSEPQRYGKKTFYRDWIDVPALRDRIDKDPVQAHLGTGYPVGGRSRFERIQAVTAYRRARRFLSLLEHWKKGEYAELFKAFQLGMDVPVYVFFHLLCPPELCRSATVVTGDLEEVWGDEELLTTSTGQGE